jgi:hypothetical protein
VMVNGQILMDDWEIVAFDEGEVIQEVGKRTRRLRESVGLPAKLV